MFANASRIGHGPTEAEQLWLRTQMCPKPLIFLVGVRGFEPPAPASRNRP